ncbi:MAG TPA: tetratricopeptide repeat protein [Anaerolineae bacterium]|nr:tetratricopeptide repeat protein [Anaerolineae bacterium]
MSETLNSNSNAQPASSSGDDRFKQIVAVLIASVTVLAAIVTYLQTSAGAQAAQASRDAQRFAIQAMGRKTSGQAQVSYDWQGAYQSWSELDDLARSADAVRDEPAAERYRAVRDRIAELSQLLDTRYFDPDSGAWPDVAAYESDTYWVNTTELSERYAAAAARQNAWSDRANVHIVQLTLLAVSLALFGLSTTLSSRSQRLFIGAGVGIVVVTLLWLLITLIQPIPDLPDQAIQAYAHGVGLAHQSRAEDAIEAFDTALAATPDYPNALYERGNAYYSLANYEDAARDYEAAAAAGRDDTNVGWNLGWTYYLLGRFEEAKRVNQHVLEMDPSLIGVRLNLALARLAAGENAAAKDDYTAAMETATQIVATARAADAEPPASLWFYLDAGALDLQNLVDRLDDKIYDWTRAPSPQTIQDPDSVKRIAQEMIDQLKSLTVALEFTGQPPKGVVTAKISPFEFAREVEDDEGNFVQYDIADAFHYRTKKVQVLFDYEGMVVGQPVLYKVYHNGSEYTSLRLTEEWLEELGESGAAQKPLSYAYSRLFILPAGHYDVEMYVAAHLVQRGSFTIHALDAPVTGQPGSVLFRDNFVDSSFAGWTRFEDEDSLRDNVANAYRISVVSPNLSVFSNPGLNFLDVQVEADVTRVGGPDSGEAGLICRYQDADNFYLLKATNEGYVSIYKLKDDAWSALVEWQLNEALALGEGATNRLRADCVGDRLALYVNDQLMIETRDAEFSAGDVGLLVGAYDEPGTDMRFDDFRVLQPLAPGSILYQEDFSDPTSGWSSYVDADYTTDYFDGGYRINVTTDNYTVWSHPGLTFSDAQIEVDAARIGGPATGEYGIVCRYQDGDNFYVLKVTGDGYYGITLRQNGEWIPLVDWQTSDAILQGEGVVNRIRADCSGSQLALYVNEQLLAETQDTEFTSGDIGLLAGTFEEVGVDVQFDNLVVRQPGVGGRPPALDSDILLQEDFADPSSGWARTTETDYTTDYADGVYRISVIEPDLTVWSQAGRDFDDVRIEVDATKLNGPDNNTLGVICRYQDGDNFYLLEISSDGYYAIAKRQAGTWSFVGSDDWRTSDVIQQRSTTNHLQADCIGETLALYVNGELLAEAQDADFTSGDVGLLAGTFDVGGVEVVFDDLIVRRP